MERLKPLNDFIFKKVFGEQGDEEVLLAFLNAILKRTHTESLTEIEIIENKELTKDQLKDKTGRIDVRARTIKGEEIDIEVQLTDQDNMDKRTLFYWGKLYLEGIKQGEDYKKLNKVITINLLDFNYLDTKSYHSSFHLWEDIEKDQMLTDLVEIHFIELPKFRKIKHKDYESDSLHRWLTFLEKDTSKNLLEELMKMERAIRSAEQKLDFLGSDPTVLEIYRARENAEHERANLISTGIDRGIKEGARQANLKTAEKLLMLNLSVESIVEATGLMPEEVEALKNK